MYHNTLATQLQNTCNTPAKKILDAHPGLNGNISDLLMNVPQHT